MQYTAATQPAEPTSARTLDEQASDFTAEGAPPPGKVGKAPPRRIKKGKFLEQGDDPAQAKELERQQDA